MNKSYISDGYKSAELFNTLAGNLENVTLASVDAQVSFIFEKLTETIDGVEKEDQLMILDGAMDLFVTVAGLMQKLDAMGYDVEQALDLVNQNNLSKFPTYVDDEDMKFIVENGFKLRLNCDSGRYIIKDTKDKIRKPLNFKPVDLSNCLPKKAA